MCFSGEVEKPCLLVLVDDMEHEEEEELRLVLGSPKSESPFGASIGKQNETVIKIKDYADSKNAWLSCSVLILTKALFLVSLVSFSQIRSDLPLFLLWY